MVSPVHKCAIYRLIVEWLSDIPANQHGLWSLHPFFLLTGSTSVFSSLLPPGHTFPAADWLLVLLLVIRWRWSSPSYQLLTVMTTLSQINTDLTVWIQNRRSCEGGVRGQRVWSSARPGSRFQVELWSSFDSESSLTRWETGTNPAELEPHRSFTATN